MRIFLGITGASGAPYAARLVDSLGAAGCELGICISRAGYEVLATELYRDVSLPQDEIAQRLIGDAEDVTIYSERDWKSPYASGSAKVDAYVICPCSMGTLGTIASGAMSNLIHRAASVALKEGRKLVVCPRETPLSGIHLENMLTLRREAAPAGADVTGVDFSEEMLLRARRKSAMIEWVQADVLALPFADESFDAATVGFGVRNLEDLERGLSELRRVLRICGRIGILE